MVHKSNELTGWMSSKEKSRYCYLQNSKAIVDKAIKDGKLELRVKDENTIIDNLEGLSFLYIPNLEFSRKVFGGTPVYWNGEECDLRKDSQSNNRIVTAYREGCGGYSGGDGLSVEGSHPTLVLLSPRSYVYHEEGYVKVFADSVKELEEFTGLLKGKLMKRWKEEFESDISFLTYELKSIESKAGSREWKAHLEEERQQEILKAKKDMKELKKIVF